jgi:cobalt-zinc-cadmium efflux system membrane fusion protein
MNKRLTPMSAVAAALLLALGMAACSKSEDKAAKPAPAAQRSPDVVELTDAQKHSIKIGQVALREFVVETQAPGTIDFNENSEVQVFSPYQGRIIAQFVHLGDFVTKGQPLFTVESADYIQAESTLIAAAAVFKQNTSALARARDLYPLKGMSQNDYEQAVANQQTADAQLKAAQKTLQIFGKTPVEVERIAASRQATPRRDSWNYPAISRRPISSPTLPRCGCWQMSPRSRSRNLASVSRLRFRSPPIQTDCLRAGSPL